MFQSIIPNNNSFESQYNITGALRFNKIYNSIEHYTNNVWTPLTEFKNSSYKTGIQFTDSSSINPNTIQIIQNNNYIINMNTQKTVINMDTQGHYNLNVYNNLNTNYFTMFYGKSLNKSRKKMNELNISFVAKKKNW